MRAIVLTAFTFDYSVIEITRCRSPKDTQTHTKLHSNYCFESEAPIKSTKMSSRQKSAMRARTIITYISRNHTDYIVLLTIYGRFCVGRRKKVIYFHVGKNCLRLPIEKHQNNRPIRSAHNYSRSFLLCMR